MASARIKHFCTVNLEVCSPIRDVLVNQGQVALPQITCDLHHSQSCSVAHVDEEGLPTLPQEKHRTGMIIFPIRLCRPKLDVCEGESGEMVECLDAARECRKIG